MIKYFLLVLVLVSANLYAEPRLRPANWAGPVIGTKLDNLYRIDKGVYRSEQPEHENVNNLKLLGIKEVLNLREYHSDDDDLKGSGFVFNRVKMDACKVTETQLIEALRIIKNRKGPILVHCWHGSDRTGVTVAAYRIIFNGWSKSQAIDEMANGGYGYHASIYPGLVTLVNDLNISRVKQALGMGLPKTSSVTR